MSEIAAPAAPTPKAIWIGWTLSGLFIAFMLFDVSIKLLQLDVVKQSLVQLGYSGDLGLVIGVIEAVCLALYLVPRTALLGAVLFMAVFGGAIASHLRLGDPLFSHVLFGVYLGLLMWGGLWLRDPGLRARFPLRNV